MDDAGKREVWQMDKWKANGGKSTGDTEVLGREERKKTRVE